MKVEILNYNENQIMLPQIAFLKLYDRRYLGERAADGEKPWNFEKETKFKKIDQKIKPRFPEPENIIRGWAVLSSADTHRRVIVFETAYFDDDDYIQELESMDPADADAVNQWKIEMRYRYDTASWFRTEYRAYTQLRSLQGTCIPTFYGVTLFDETSKLPLGVETDVLGILIEFIDGVTLEELSLQSPLATSNPHIGQAAVDCFERIIPLGVLQGDVRLANVMVNNNGRVYLIDFAFGSFRGNGISDEDWEDRAIKQQEALEVKLCLDDKGLRDRTPPEPYSDHIGNYWYYNRAIENAREAWRLKYYDALSEDVIPQ